MAETSRLRKHAKKLLKIRKASQADRPKLTKKYLTETDFVKCICECCSNILNGNVPLTASQRDKLKGRKTSLRQLVDNQTPLSKKKKIIQTGGFLGAILGPVVSVLGGLLGNVFGQK